MVVVRRQPLRRRRSGPMVVCWVCWLVLLAVRGRRRSTAAHLPRSAPSLVSPLSSPRPPQGQRARGSRWMPGPAPVVVKRESAPAPRGGDHDAVGSITAPRGCCAPLPQGVAECARVVSVVGGGDVPPHGPALRRLRSRSVQQAAELHSAAAALLAGVGCRRRRRRGGPPALLSLGRLGRATTRISRLT